MVGIEASDCVPHLVSQVLHEMYHKYHDEWIVDLLYKDCVRPLVPAV